MKGLTEQLLLTYLLSSSVDEKNSFITRSVLEKEISALKAFINSQKKTTSDPLYTGHLLLALKRMETPAIAKPTAHAVMPPGAPIGCGDDGE
jgi:hypothetical protein